MNEAFIEISGFTEAELIGSPHNIVRHPDMPVEAFFDMWSMLKNGNSWADMVKNRRKNGDYYWVLANATPIKEGGSVIGYTSVRTAPSQDQIAQASSAYARFKEGNQWPKNKSWTGRAEWRHRENCDPEASKYTRADNYSD